MYDFDIWANSGAEVEIENELGLEVKNRDIDTECKTM